MERGKKEYPTHISLTAKVDLQQAVQANAHANPIIVDPSAHRRLLVGRPRQRRALT
jgi:hypothetical protein